MHSSRRRALLFPKIDRSRSLALAALITTSLVRRRQRSLQLEDRSAQLAALMIAALNGGSATGGYGMEKVADSVEVVE